MKLARYFGFTFLGLLLWTCNPAEKKAPVENNPANTGQIEKSLIASTTDWNNGNLEGFVSVYDSSATFMTASGLIGLDTLKAHYQRKYFNGTKPKQQLAFDEIQVKPLSTSHALVTGRFILTGQNLPEQSGRFSLVFVNTAKGWKILHDHSS